MLITLCQVLTLRLLLSHQRHRILLFYPFLGHVRIVDRRVSLLFKDLWQPSMRVHFSREPEFINFLDHRCDDLPLWVQEALWLRIQVFTFVFW